MDEKPDKNIKAPKNEWVKEGFSQGYGYLGLIYIIFVIIFLFI